MQPKHLIWQFSNLCSLHSTSLYIFLTPPSCENPIKDSNNCVSGRRLVNHIVNVPISPQLFPQISINLDDSIFISLYLGLVKTIHKKRAKHWGVARKHICKFIVFTLFCQSLHVFSVHSLKMLEKPCEAHDRECGWPNYGREREREIACRNTPILSCLY